MILVWLVIPLIAATCSAHYAQKFYDELLDQMDIIDVTFSVYDAETGEVIRALSANWVHEQGPCHDIAQKLAQRSTARISAANKFTLKTVAAWTMTFKMGSEGYEAQEVKVRPGTIAEIDVHLRKVASGEPAEQGK